MALADQMIRAARLDTEVYEEVERNTDQTTNALLVVVMAALAAGISAAITAAQTDVGGGVITGLIGGVIAALVGWAVWTACVYWIGTSFFGGTATWGEVLRTVGFANSPGVLRILGFIPVLGGLINLAVFVWIILATVVAVRQALDVTTGKAVIVSILGAILAAIVFFLVGLIFAVPVALMGGAA